MVTTGMSAGDTAVELWAGGGDVVDTSGIVFVVFSGGRAGDGGVTCTTGGVVLGLATGAE
jgi:hypothetical protein